jgi:hypothetical protein
MIPENLPLQEQQSGATPAASTGNDAGNNPGSDNPSSSVSPQSILADLNRLCREGQLEFLFRLEDSSILEGTGYALARAEIIQLGQEARRLGQEATAHAAEAIESAKEALEFAREQHQKAMEWKEKLDHITPKPKKTGREAFIDELLRQGVEWAVWPGASLLTYAPQYALGELITGMAAHLTFWWPLCVKHSGPSARLPGKFVFVQWKPLLWFTRGGRRDREYVADLVESEPPERPGGVVPLLHHWQQSLVEAEYYIGRLTQEGELVVDPLCGSGSTCVAALKGGRRTLGIERDPERANVARGRIAELNPGKVS